MIAGYLSRRAVRRARQAGNAARDARDWVRAARAYRRYLDAVPDDFAIRVQLGHVLTEAGDYDAADQAYAAAEALRADDADLLLCWGHSRKIAGDSDAALRLYERSAAIDGNLHATGEIERLRPPVIEQPAPPPPPALPEPAWAARIEVAKPFACGRGEVALFVTHSATGALKPHVAPYLAALRAQGIAVLLIAVTDGELNIRPDVLDLVAGALVRENRGYDFAAWAHAVRLHPEVYGASTLYLLNDSVAGPAGGGAFGAMLDRVRASEADLIGLTESHEYRWHLQSYFLALKPRLLSSFRLHRFFDEVRLLDDKDAVIRSYELSFTWDMEHSGHNVEVLFPSPVALNPTLFAWRELIADGFPFIKLLLLRGHFPDADIEGWERVLAETGFDLRTIRGSLKAAEEHPPRDHAHRLYAHQLPQDIGRGSGLKVAFYGPWNYDNGLGAASRGIIGAIRRTGVRLNLHPIVKPFHIHRPLTPPVDVAEFHGPADIAIVHLNPDTWFHLTDEQRAEVGRAKTRIGYWVWELDRLPESWNREFYSVDRIWAPSRYCAELFAAQDGAPVDVIPHVVPIPATKTGDRARVMERLGLPADRRILLFVFDGSSYLVRKNPHALVRAFAAAGLGQRGWTLVLKTKHLMDRPEDGRRFRELAESVADVRLIDSAMGSDELTALMDAADLYASPHCSEGFGLTIAEAMAAGKPVVATDFGGSRDFVDAQSGYPVPAEAVTLDEDFGHYTRGGVWGRIDEQALAETLARAAAAIEAGDDTIAQAGRRRVAETLSLEAVGARIADSFDALRSRRGTPPGVDRLHLGLHAAMAFDGADLGPNMRAVALGADGSAQPGATGLPDGLPADRDHWVALAPTGSLIPHDLARIVTDHARPRPDVSIFYGDDVAAETDQPIDQLRLKPDFDLTLLLAQDYVGAPVIVRASALDRIGGLRREAGTAAVTDLLLRAQAQGLSIARIPQVLLAHPGKRVRATMADHRRLVAAHPLAAGCDLVEGLSDTGIALRQRFAGDAPPVTIIVPTRRTPLPDESGTYVERLLEGIARTDWPMDRLNVIVGDDVEGEPAWAGRRWPFALRRIETPRGSNEPFNYAAKMNRLWRAAGTEQILFLNDDVRPLDDGWLKALQTFAVRRDVGGVGARLLFEDGSLQHAGLGPHGDCAAHIWVYRPRREGTYQDWALTQREWSMVTGAVFATKRSLMEEVDGFEERFSLEFNDTDLCLRLRALGYRIVCTPLAEMVHTEKASRGERLPPGDDLALFLSRWKPWLAQDPHWHPGLDRGRLEMTPRRPDGGEWYL